MENAEKIKINTPFIKLDQFLKFSGTVSDGSDAKYLILEGYVKVNGEKEIRRGRKLYANDNVCVEYEGEKINLTVCDWYAYRKIIFRKFQKL